MDRQEEKPKGGSWFSGSKPLATIQDEEYESEIPKSPASRPRRNSITFSAKSKAVALPSEAINPVQPGPSILRNPLSPRPPAAEIPGWGNDGGAGGEWGAKDDVGQSAPGGWGAQAAADAAQEAAAEAAEAEARAAEEAKAAEKAAAKAAMAATVAASKKGKKSKKK